MKSPAYNATIRKLENELSQLEIHPQCFIEATEKAIGLCNKVILELREMVLKHGFSNDAEEIYFFKQVKPRVYSRLIYYTEVFNIEAHRPESEVNDQIGYLKYMLQKHTKEIKEDKAFYQYYKRKKTYSDHIYFLRGNTDHRIHMDHIPNYLDPDFSTGYDCTLAKMMACEQLQKYLCNEIQKLKVNSKRNMISFNRSKPNSTLEWTGSNINAVELVYALYYARVINNGQADIIEIAHAFEKMFNIKLDDIYRTFKDIQGRTKVKTRFLDKLREILLNRLDDLDK